MPLIYGPEPPPEDAFKVLHGTTGWGSTTRSVADFAEALNGSWCCRSACGGNTLLGIGRLVSNGGVHAFITVMIVPPDHQQRGIGAMILRKLVSASRAAGISDIQRFCAEGKQDFYRKAGFESRPPSPPCMQFVNL